MWNTKKKITSTFAATLAVSTLFAVGGCANLDKKAASESGAGGGGQYSIAVVPKMTGETWFERMQAGVE